MPLFQAFSIGNRLIAMITCSALAVLVLFQLRHDAKSRLFGILMIDITAVAFFGSLSRLASALGYGEHAVFVLFTIGSIFTGTLPALIFIFSVELLGTWTMWRRWVARILVAVGLIAAVQFVLDRGFTHFSMSIEGYVNYTLYPFVNALLAIGELGVLLSLRIALEQYLKKRNEANIRLLIGFGILCVGYLTIIVQEVNRYAPQLALFAIGSVVMAGAILQQRLFDPLSQLNVKLARRAEQLSILTRVGQQATSFLKQDELLNVIVQEIQRAFNYYAVGVFLLDDPGQTMVIKAAAGANAEAFVASGLQWDMTERSLIGAAALSRRLVNVGDVHEDTRYIPHTLHPNTRSEVSLPLVVGATNSEQALIGVLDIQSDRRGAFTAEDLEVLQILANQIAIAIRNAQLFEEAQKARQIADEANRKKTNFLSEMSHELRTPLQVVITRSQWMLKRPELYGGVQLPEAYIADLASIETSGKHLHKLINNILDLSKIEAGEVKVEISMVDPLPILQDVQESFTALLHKGVEIQAVYSEHLPYILGNDLHIRQILTNLMSNACKFTQQGFIILDAQVIENDLRFSVADTGPGIPAEAQPMLFKPYGQANKELARKHGGTGLGLYVSKQLVTLYKGEIWYTSAVDQGATFYFTIPLARAEDQPVAKSSSDQPSSRVAIVARRPRSLPAQILVIDMHPDTRQQLETTLSQIGYSVVAADTASLGMTLGALVTPKAVVVMSHSLDSAETQECLQRLRTEENLKGVPIIEKVAEESSDWWKELLKQLPPITTYADGLASEGKVLTPSADQASSRMAIFGDGERKLPAQVLLVDTNSRTRQQLETALSQVGYSVVGAGTVSLGIALGSLSTPSAVAVIAHSDNLLEMLELAHLLRSEGNLKGVPIIESRVTDETSIWQEELLTQLQQSASRGDT